MPFSSISLCSPTIVSGPGYEGLQAQLFTVPPCAIAFVVTVIVSWQSDKRGMRSWGAFCSLAIAGVSFLVQGTCNTIIWNSHAHHRHIRSMTCTFVRSALRLSLHHRLVLLRQYSAFAQLAHCQPATYWRFHPRCSSQCVYWPDRPDSRYARFLAIVATNWMIDRRLYLQELRSTRISYRALYQCCIPHRGRCRDLALRYIYMRRNRSLGDGERE